MLSYFLGMYGLHATTTRALKLEYDDVAERLVEIPALYRGVGLNWGTSGAPGYLRSFLAGTSISAPSSTHAHSGRQTMRPSIGPSRCSPPK